jgi:hypothetical protein
MGEGLCSVGMQDDGKQDVVYAFLFRPRLLTQTYPAIGST